MRVAAAILALIAVALMTLAIASMVTGKPGGDRAGFFIRAGALLAFVAAVVLNVTSR